MRFGSEGVPLILLSHRQTEFLEHTIQTLREHITGVTDVVVVDDSGNPEHHDWLDRNNFQFQVVHPTRNMGYLDAMKTVWGTAKSLTDGYALLWEEDFILTKPLNTEQLVTIMDNPRNERLAQLNLQRQAVYHIERRLGYLESHQRRGYGLSRVIEPSTHSEWVRRRKPFTTNPGLIRQEVLNLDWPLRKNCDLIAGGAEPAMSLSLERKGYHFGWFGKWNQAHTHHVGTTRKSGIGY